MLTLGTTVASFIGRFSTVTPNQALNSSGFPMLYYPVYAPFFLRTERIPRRRHWRQPFFGLRSKLRLYTHIHTHTHTQNQTRTVAMLTRVYECVPHRQYWRQLFLRPQTETQTIHTHKHTKPDNNGSHANQGVRVRTAQTKHQAATMVAMATMASLT